MIQFGVYALEQFPMQFPTRFNFALIHLTLLIPKSENSMFYIYIYIYKNLYSI